MKLKIISDGTTAGTKVINADTGEKLEDVVEVSWAKYSNGDILTTLTIIGGDIDLTAPTCQITMLTAADNEEKVLKYLEEAKRIAEENKIFMAEANN